MRASAFRAALAALYDAALAALAPEPLVRRALGTRALAGVRRAMGRHGVIVIGAGKGAARLAAAVERVLGPTVLGGCVIVPPGYERRLRRIGVALGSHPLPDGRSVRATRRLLATLARAPRDAAVLVVLTGGASSLLVAPAPGLTLADKRRTHALLLASGADIGEVNAVRAALSAVKGGRLAAHLRGRAAAALVVADVPGDDPAVVGSGPTLPSTASRARVRAVLRRHRLVARLPPAVRRHLFGSHGRGPRPAGVPTVLLAGNRTARRAVATAARALGCRRVIRAAALSGSTTEAAARFAGAIHRAGRLGGPGPVALVAGGETTVALGRAPGKGGRNQEVALAVALALADMPGWALLCAGTDGIDGPTDAAGACVDGATAARARRRGADPVAALARHDVYPVLARVGALFRPGPTGTNVADLALAIVEPRALARAADRPWRAPGGVV